METDKDVRSERAVTAAIASFRNGEKEQATDRRKSILQVIRKQMETHELRLGKGDAEQEELQAEKDKSRRRENPTDEEKIIDEMNTENSLQEQRYLICSVFTKIGIDWKSYQDDLYGDGDQTDLAAGSMDLLNEILYDKHFDFEHSFQEAHALDSFEHRNGGKVDPDTLNERLDVISRHCGFDAELLHEAMRDHIEYIENRGLSKFAYFCFLPDIHISKIEELILATRPGSVERKRLLERRETTFRLTPLHLVVFTSRVLRDDIATDAFQGAVNILLKYGANPFARDITGRTVLHHATDPYLPRTSNSLTLAQMCVDTSKKYAVVHQNVVLEGLSRLELNGKTGYCGGYDASVGRFVVYLFKEDKTMRKQPIAVKPENVVTISNEGHDYDENEKLVDCCARHGATALFPVALDGKRVDTASFLLRNGASIDIETDFGMTARSIATDTLAQIFLGQDERPVDTVIRRRIAKQEKKKQTGLVNANVCVLCERKGETFPCSACAGVWYCGAECSRQHWNAHKGHCRSAKNILLGPPTKDELDPGLIIHCYSQIENASLESLHGGYNPPDGYTLNEAFWLKVTSFGDSHLLCYDKSRTCCFVIINGSEGFQATFELLHPNKIQPFSLYHYSSGWKPQVFLKSLHFYATFNDDGVCKIFPKSARIRGSF